MKFTPLFLAALSFLPLAASASSLSDDVLGELYVMRNVYQTAYAPAEWKKKYLGYDLDTNFESAKAALAANPSLSPQNVRDLFKNFVYAMHDYHVSVSFSANEAASLPLTVRGAQGHYFLVNIDRAKLSEASFPFHEGDELVTFGGVPVNEAVQAVLQEVTPNIATTDQALAELNLTRRRASRGYRVPQGPVMLGIVPKGETKAREIQLQWDYTPETIAPRGLTGATALSPEPRSSLFRPMMTVERADVMAENPYGIGSRKTFTPDLGAKIFETADDNTFYAYIYQNADHKLIGYLRLPSYVPSDYKKAVTDFAAIVARFESTTDAMVIDQVNNPGGSVFYLYELASMLSDQPLRAPRHKMSLTADTVSEALADIEKLRDVKDEDSARKAISDTDMDGYPVTYQFAQFTLSYARFLVNEWNAGRRLTNPYWIGGVDQINPSATHYSKPILVLVNELDFSGGDFFPTILQDNKRATIMGTRTSGAGGYVADVQVPNSVGVAAFRVTGSIAERVDGNPIENLGVTPDIQYQMTPADYTGHYAPYVNAIQTAVSGLLSTKK